MSTKNKKTASRIFEELYNARKIEVAPELYTADAVLHDLYDPVLRKGIDGVKAYLQTFTKAFPDLHFTIEDQIAEGDKVVTRLTATGTHQGEILGAPPSHKKASAPVVVIHTFRDGKVCDSWIMWDALGFLRTTGALEAMKPALTHA